MTTELETTRLAIARAQLAQERLKLKQRLDEELVRMETRYNDLLAEGSTDAATITMTEIRHRLTDQFDAAIERVEDMVEGQAARLARVEATLARMARALGGQPEAEIEAKRRVNIIINSDGVQVQEFAEEAPKPQQAPARWNDNDMDAEYGNSELNKRMPAYRDDVHLGMDGEGGKKEDEDEGEKGK